jgi:hypothetical protein
VQASKTENRAKKKKQTGRSKSKTYSLSFIFHEQRKSTTLREFCWRPENHWFVLATAHLPNAH